MGSAIDGLISGLDTTTIISQLMQLEALPQTQLKAKVTTTDSIVTALQALNTKVSSLGDSAKTAATAASWQAVNASSSATSTTATTTSGAQPSSLTFTVAALATRQTSLGTTATATTLAANFGGSLTLARGTTTAPTATAISLSGVTDLAGVAKAINEADAGVTATLVKVSDTESRLQLTSTATGVASGFDLFAGTLTAAEVQAAPAAPAGAALMGRAADTLIGAAADAKITLWAGTGAAVEVSSTTNTFTGVLTGVDFTITKVETDPITLTVARNNTALTTLASGLVTNISTVLAEITSRTKSITSTVDGREVTKGGILSGDSAVRGIQQSIVTAASDPVNGISPSTVGVVLGKDGTITFDATIFAAALAADPDKVQAVISGLAERLSAVSTNLSNKSTGGITLKIQGQQSYVKGLGDQVLNWDTRLEMRQAALEKQYAALEVALGKLGSQSDWLTSQLDSLSNNNNN